jgi:hypothetical protein
MLETKDFRATACALAAGLLVATVASAPLVSAHARPLRRLAASSAMFATVSPSPFIHVRDSANIVARVPAGESAADVKVTLNGERSGFTLSTPTSTERSHGVVAVVTAPSHARKASVTVSIPGTADSQTLPIESYFRPDQLVAGKGAWISFDAYGQMPYSTMLQEMAEEGVHHVYVETTGVNFIGEPYLNALLEQAHNLGIAVIAQAWAPLSQVQQEINSAGQTIAYTTPDGGQVDGFAGDFEQNLSAGAMQEFSAAIRQDLGPNRVYVGIIYAPQFGFATPIATMAHYVNVFAPMDYWDDSADRSYSLSYVESFVAASIKDLMGTPGEDNIPVEVVSQTQDINSDSGFGPLNPPAAQVLASAKAAAANGALAVSFYELCNQTAADIADITHFHM